MEEVWKEINLASLHHQNPHGSMLKSHQTHNPNSILQDFLNRPLNQEPPISLSMASSIAPPATLLSLNSTAGFQFLDNPDSHLHLSANLSSFTTHFEALTSAGHFGCHGKKRGQDSDGSSSGSRQKRLIKNRESAARSRARKQAYTNELELKVAHLQAENARLKREQDQLMTMVASQLHKKNTLQRTSTAPF